MNASFPQFVRPLLSVLLCVLAASIVCGCKKPPEPPPKPEPAAAVSVTTEPAVVAKVEGATEEFPNPGLLKPGTLNDDGVEVGAGALTDALQNYFYATAGQVPASLEDMVRLKIIARVPTPPAGKKYVLDRKKAVVTLENAR